MLMRWIDKFLGRYFLAWCVTGVFMYKKVVTEESWMWITIVFLAGGIATKGFDVWANKKK